MTMPISFAPTQLVRLATSGKFPFALRVITREDDRGDVFALRYQAYHEAGHVPFDATGRYQDRHDDMPGTAAIAAFDGETCVGTIRVSFSMPWQPVATLPCAAYYPGVQAIKRRAGGPLIEVSRLAVDPALSNRSYRTTLYASLVRAGLMAAQAGQVEHIFIATKPECVRFYRYMLGFEQVGKAALYPPGNIPISLMGGSLAQAEKQQLKQNAFFKITLDEIVSMRAALRSVLARPTAGDNRSVMAV